MKLSLGASSVHTPPVGTGEAAVVVAGIAADVATGVAMMVAAAVAAGVTDPTYGLGTALAEDT